MLVRLDGWVEGVALVDYEAVDGGVEGAGGFCEAGGGVWTIRRGCDLSVGEEGSGELREMGPGCGEGRSIVGVGVVGTHDGPDVVVVGVVAEGGAEESDFAGFWRAGGGGDGIWNDRRAG